MDYLKPVKRAWEITKQNKFLWWLGLLAALTEGGGSLNLGNFNSSDIQKIFDKTSPSEPNQNPITNVATKVLGDKSTDWWQIISGWFSQYWLVLTISGIIFMIICLLILVVSFMAKAGLIWAGAEIEKKRQTNFKASFRKGYQLFWRILGIYLIFGLMAIGAIFLFVIPTTLFGIYSIWWGALIYGLILILPLIGFMIWIVIAEQYALRYGIVENLGVLESFRNGFQIFHQNLKNALIFWLIGIGLKIVISIVIGLAFLIIVLILVALGFGVWALASWLGVIVYGVIFGLLFFLVLWLLSGIITCFMTTYWTLVYLELTK